MLCVAARTQSERMCGIECAAQSTPGILWPPPSLAILSDSAVRFASIKYVRAPRENTTLPHVLEWLDESVKIEILQHPTVVYVCIVYIAIIFFVSVLLV